MPETPTVLSTRAPAFRERWGAAMERSGFRKDPIGGVLVLLPEVVEALDAAVAALGETREPQARVIRAAIDQAIRGSLLARWRRDVALTAMICLVLGLALGGILGWLGGHVPWACMR